jgi:CRISPR-associated exonuclease Cas4
MTATNKPGSLYGSADYPEDDWLALGGIQHYTFCKRQWALIHIEQLWEDNARTTSGSLDHKRADDYKQSESRGDILRMHSLRVFSHRLGVTGICDVVEFHRDPQGVELQGRKGTWAPYPVEYKHGHSKIGDEDRLQLCAEAMCLEEMLGCDIPQAALFYKETKRREVVDLDEELRNCVIETYGQMRDFYNRRLTPEVRRTKACNACSLKNLCMPELEKKRSVKRYIEQALAEA